MADRHVAPILVSDEHEAWPPGMSRQRQHFLVELGLVERLRDFEAEGLAPEGEGRDDLRHVELEEGEANVRFHG